MTPLTISKSKTAVLLRLPKPVIAELDRMARSQSSRGRRVRRTGVIYAIIAANPKLKKLMNEFMEDLSCRPRTAKK